MFHRRTCLRLLTGLGLACAASLPAAAQSFPSKPVRIVVPQTPGGASDALARVIAQKLNDKWKQPVVVENKAGAGGNIGTELVAKSPADGYTLLMSYAGTQAINPSLYASLPYDSVKDFQPVATLATVPFVLIVNKNLAVTDLKQFLALAREKPDQIAYGSAGNGSVNHLLGVMMSTDAKVKLMHVPYRGAAPALTDLMSGQIQAVFTSLPSVIGHIREGAVARWRSPAPSAPVRHPTFRPSPNPACPASTSIRGSGCWRRPARRRRWCARSTAMSRRRCRRKTRSSASPARAPSPSSPRPSSSSPCFRPTWRSGARS